MSKDYIEIKLVPRGQTISTRYLDKEDYILFKKPWVLLKEKLRHIKNLLTYRLGSREVDRNILSWLYEYEQELIQREKSLEEKLAFNRTMSTKFNKL